MCVPYVNFFPMFMILYSQKRILVKQIFCSFNSNQRERNKSSQWSPKLFIIFIIRLENYLVGQGSFQVTGMVATTISEPFQR